MEKKINLWVIPTDKPSRLVKNINENTLKLCIQTLPLDKELGCFPQNIYITSDEEIKVGDLIFETDNNTINVVGKDYVENELDFKIILTTDQDLIKDGVQAIDDEFLEWFVKNSSCKEVNINQIQQIPDGITFGIFGNDEPPTELVYKIIIPSEEPSPFELPKALPDDVFYKSIEQGTLEEVAKTMYPNKTTKGWIDQYSAIQRIHFIEGAKWQQEQDNNKYSEEELREAIKLAKEYDEWSLREFEVYIYAYSEEDIVKQFKKK